MKKFILSALAYTCMGFAFVSCNNGDYDANPDTNHNNVPNPLNPDNSPGNNVGDIVAKINGDQKVFKGTAKDTLGMLYLTGFTGTSFPMQGIRLGFLNYEGVKVYSSTDMPQTVAGGYSLLNSAMDVKDYIVTGFEDGGRLKLEVTEDKDNKLKGTFEGVFYNMVDDNDSVVISEGKFYLQR